MNDNTEVETSEVNNEVNEVQTLKQQLEEAQKAIQALVNKKEELLKETKAAKEEKRRKAEEALQVAEKNGEFEKLYKQAQEERSKLEQQLTQDRKDRRDEKISLEAIKIANDLAKGDAYKAELLSNFVAKSLSNIADDFGRVGEDVLTSVKQQFETDKKFAPLLGGNLSVGGSAPGNAKSSGSATQNMTRADFDKMPVWKQAEFISKVRKGSATLSDN